MRLLRWRQMLQLVLACGSVWLLLILYTHTSVRLSMDTMWNSVLRRNLDRERLRELMSPSILLGHNNSIQNPLELLTLPSEGMLSFYWLALRRPLALYTELTSANRDTSYPLAPDFTFHLSYHEQHVVLYEDEGPGCVYRIYLLPPLPRDATRMHQLTTADMRNAYLSMVIDDRTFWFSLQQVMEGREWPFLAPINTQHPRPASGVGTYTPFCYQSRMQIAYQHSDPLPPSLFEEMINCSKNDLLCSTHIYSGISRYKFPPGTLVPSFATQNVGKHKKAVETAAHMLSKPELYGPDSGERCVLDCVELCAECRHRLLRLHQPGVIASIKMRVFETASSKPLADWNSLHLTMHFDGALNPQVDHVPLGSFFGASGSHNELRGASVGRRKRTCSYSDGLLELPATALTSYVYLPMPFWRNALVAVEGTRAVDTSLLVCYKLSLVENTYKEEETAYFHARKSLYDGAAVDGWRDILSLGNAWGHIVGLHMEVDMLRANRQGSLNQRWAALQADMVLYVDGARAASVLGTGLEDYFSYAHGFALAENTSYNFVGVYHASPRRSEPLSWHCYRWHIVDPIPFRRSVHFLSEGTKSNWFQKQAALRWDDYHTLRTEGSATIAYLVHYYARRRAGATVTDVMELGDANSETQHDFKMVPMRGGRANIRQPPEVQTVSGRRYLGNAKENITYTRTFRPFDAGDAFTFTVHLLTPNRGVVLRREFYSRPRVWNARAEVTVNGKRLGVWFIPFGTLVEEYSLNEDDFLIGPEITDRQTQLTVEIAPQTPWYDISYHVMVVH